MRRRWAALLASGVALAALPAAAMDADWLAAPADGDFNNANNWSTAAVPGAGDTAFFNASAITSLSITASRQLGGWTFNAGAPAYDFTNGFAALVFDGQGIVVNGAGVTIANAANGIVAFIGTSAAGSADILNNVGSIQFADDSSAADARITNAHNVLFFNQSTAGNAIVDNGATGLVRFFIASTAGNAVINNAGVLQFTDTASADNAFVTTRAGGITTFEADATGGSARFVTEAGGSLDISGLAVDGTTAGSIEGGGLHSLGEKDFEVGANGLDTQVSGVIADGGLGGGAGGSLTKVGTGTLTLSGTNTYSGSTRVFGGSLIVNGSIAASSFIEAGPGTTVGGSGVLPSTSINAGATLAPGNSVGMINVVGDLGFATGSTYEVEISPTAADLTNVTGTANLAGAIVEAIYEPGSYVAKKYTILTSAGVIEPFNGLAGAAPAGFVHKLAYDATHAYLVLALQLSPGTSAFAALNQNQQAVATAIAKHFDQAGMLPMAFSGLTPADLTLISGEVTTAAISAGFHATDQFVGLLADPTLRGALPAGALAAYGEEQPKTPAATYEPLLGTSGSRAADAHIGQVFSARWTMWGAAYGGAQQIGGNAVVGSADLDAGGWGAAAGGDYRWSGGRVGFGLGGGASSFGLSGGLGSGRLGTFNAGIYATQDLGDAYLSGVLAYGFHAARTSRIVGADLISGSFGAHSFSGRVEAGYRFGAGAAAFVPYAAVQATSLHLPAHAETSSMGGAFVLDHASQTELAARTELGARVTHDFGALRFTGRAAWAYNAANARAAIAAFPALPGATFTIDGAAPARHALLLDAGIEANLAEGLAARLTFSGEFSRNVVSYGAGAKLSYRW